MAKSNFISHDRLVQLLDYDPATGLFTWVCDRCGRNFKDRPAGHLKTNGCTEITVRNKRFHIGVFDTIDEAGAAYLQFKKILTGQEEFRR